MKATHLLPTFGGCSVGTGHLYSWAVTQSQTEDAEAGPGGGSPRSPQTHLPRGRGRVQTQEAPDPSAPRGRDSLSLSLPPANVSVPRGPLPKAAIPQAVVSEAAATGKSRAVLCPSQSRSPDASGEDACPGTRLRWLLHLPLLSAKVGIPSPRGKPRLPCDRPQHRLGVPGDGWGVPGEGCLL